MNKLKLFKGSKKKILDLIQNLNPNLKIDKNRKYGIIKINVSDYLILFNKGNGYWQAKGLMNLTPNISEDTYYFEEV